MRPSNSIFLFLLLLFVAVPISAQTVTKALKLEDQFGASVDIRIGSGKSVVMIVSEKREAAEEIAAWEKQLGSLPSDAVLYRVANLKAIPFFVPKGSVTKDLKSNYPSMSIALDWKGAVSAELRAPKGATAVLVFGPDGAELGHVAGTASQSGAANVKALLSRIGR